MRFIDETSAARPARRTRSALAWGIVLLATVFAGPTRAEDSAPVTSEAVATPAPAATAAEESPAQPASDAVVKPAPTPPTGFDDIDGWIRYKVASQRTALPEEARLFYHRGLMAWASGQRDAAVRWVRAASELDPTFAAPHTTLFSWFAFSDPGQALLEASMLFQFARESFVLQLWLAANGLHLVLQAIFLGLLAAGLLIVVHRNSELRHGWQERLTGFLTGRAAKKWPWVFLAVPFVIGLGIAWPTVVLLAMLWPSLRAAERGLFVVLLAAVVATPLAVPPLSRLATPLGKDGAPFHGTIALQGQTAALEQREQYQQLAAQHPNDRLLQFAQAWTARQNDDFVAAETGYRGALKLAPDDDRALNNLGNVLAMQGRYDEAVKAYDKATQTNSKNAAAFFNLSQVHGLRFEYQAANEALAHASALNFDMLRKGQEQSTKNGQLVLVDQWMAPRLFWEILLGQSAPSDPRTALPPDWRRRIEFAGWSFSLVTLLGALAALVAGILLHRSNPLRRCGNCERVVCRRCAERRRELALCRSCASTDARAEAADFARVLLEEHRKKLQLTGRIVRTVLAALIPGYGLLAFRRVVLPTILLVFCAGLAVAWSGTAAPYAYEPTFDAPNRDALLTLTLALGGVIYAISILGYFIELRRADARAAGALKSLRPRGGAKRRITSAAA